MSLGTVFKLSFKDFVIAVSSPCAVIARMGNDHLEILNVVKTNRYSLRTFMLCTPVKMRCIKIKICAISARAIPA